MKRLLLAAIMGGLAMGVGRVASAEDGAALYKSKMCGTCHGAGKKGGDLKASTMDKARMVKFMKDPKSVLPKATMPATKGTDAELNALADYIKGMK